MKVITTHYIDGKIVEPHGRGVMDSINPSNNTVIGRVTLADEEDAKRSDQNRERFPIRPSCLHKRDDLQRARRVASQILAGRVAIMGCWRILRRLGEVSSSLEVANSEHRNRGVS